MLITGIGGQGIQLAAKILAEAANRSGKNVLLFGLYGGVIRGGPSDCTIVAADGDIAAPPIIDEAWACLAMHPRSFADVLPKLRPRGVVLANSTLVTGRVPSETAIVIEVPATRIAEEAGNIVGATLVALGAFVETTGFVAAATLSEAMKSQVPAHRQRLVAFNERCLALGGEWVRRHQAVLPQARAWTGDGAATAPLH